MLGTISLPTEAFLAYFIAAALSDLARIPANVLILMFFKPVRANQSAEIHGSVAVVTTYKQPAGGSGTVSNISVTTNA